MRIARAKALSCWQCFHGNATTLAFGIAAVLSVWSSESKAQYKVGAGDVLEISIASLPEFRQRLMVDIDGKVSLPLLGEVNIDGTTLDKIRELAKREISQRTFTKVTSDGREKQVIISPQEINISLVEYRPIYIRGNIENPGQHPFRPGMTVRQATALAGGAGLLGRTASQQRSELVSLNGEDTSLRLDILREQARSIRARAELSNAREADFGPLMTLGVPQQLASKIASAEAENLKARLQGLEAEKVFLQNEITRGEERSRLLEQQLQADQDNARADAIETAKLRELAQKGLVTTGRVADAQRLSLASLTRLAQSGVQAELIRRERYDNARKIERLEEQRRTELLREHQDADLKLASLRARLNSVGQRAAINSGDAQDFAGSPKLVARLFRRGGPPEGLTVDDNEMELLPGDVLEITLQLSQSQATNAASSETAKLNPEFSRPLASNHQTLTANQKLGQHREENGSQ